MTLVNWDAATIIIPHLGRQGQVPCLPSAMSQLTMLVAGSAGCALGMQEPLQQQQKQKQALWSGLSESNE